MYQRIKEIFVERCGRAVVLLSLVDRVNFPIRCEGLTFQLDRLDGWSAGLLSFRIYRDSLHAHLALVMNWMRMYVHVLEVSFWGF